MKFQLQFTDTGSNRFSHKDNSHTERNFKGLLNYDSIFLEEKVSQRLFSISVFAQWKTKDNRLAFVAFSWKRLPVCSCVLRYLVVSAVGGGWRHVCLVVVMAGEGRRRGEA
jgi:hypothetical protein